MRAIFVLFDSLNRLALGPYGGSIGTPNFDRLAQRGVTFDKHYVGSLPCIPARRDLQTGRASFFHRSWGPMEPFDRSFTGVLREKGVHSRLVTDHYHYFREGGSHYHTRYDSWDLIRGQENDNWKALVDPPLERWARDYDPRHYLAEGLKIRQRHLMNREYERGEEDMPMPRCFDAGFEFLEANRAADDWMLQLELFDPHEPFDVPERFRRPGDSTWQGGVLNWPPYKRVDETEEEIAEIRASYAALVRMCDEYLGRLLDYMDAHDMWRDTALVVTTDHGFLLSEHDWWGKGRMPYYEELVHTPLFVCHPDHAGRGGHRCGALTQTIDVMPTIIDIFGGTVPAEARGRSLLPLVAGAKAEDRIVAFGYFAGPVGVMDGRYKMLHYPPDIAGKGLHEYTLMPQHLAAPFTVEELQTARLHPPFDFTRGIPLLQIDALIGAARPPGRFDDCAFRLFDLETDPQETRPFRDAEIEARLYAGLGAYMEAHDAPTEYATWLGLNERAQSHEPTP
ncbi:sulfatase [Solirhodobacter olei]|uniref:sulfatase n=1 Tax=Solirhodobacter olei TaxID=2493082 RepID=UPI000FD9C9B2|nr:sulfatase [Solirhodobacter olei]